LSLATNVDAYSGRKAESKGLIYIGIFKGDFCTNTLNFPCWDAKKKRINKKNKFPNLYYYDGSNYEILTTDDSRFYLFRGVSSPAWKREKFRLKWGNKFDSNYGDGNLISIHNSMSDAKAYIKKDIANLNKEKNKPKTVAKKPKPELGIPSGYCPGEDGKSLVPCEDEIVKKPKPNIPEKNISRSKEIDSSLITIGSGSGFYINNKGYALTNNHVIDICKQSIAVIDGKETLFRVIATDKTNDVAVLKTDYKSSNFIKINEDGAKLGENVIAVGYPLAGRLSDSVKITRGIVSSLSGLDNNIGQIQIDAALQPGNSGGPVLNENGELVGIASAGLNKLLMAKEAKYIPENVNFAVASPIVVNILKSKKVKYTTPGVFGGSFSNTELAELGDSSTIQLFCRNTRAEYARLKRSKQYSQVLLDID